MQLKGGLLHRINHCPIGSRLRTAQKRLTHVRLQRKAQKGTDQYSADPDFDELELNQDYYNLIGMTKEEADEDLENMWNCDPMNDPDIDSDDDSDEEQDLQSARLAQELQKEMPFGPLAMVVAGFREHEIGMVRAILDEAGAYELKVLPCTAATLQGSVETAIYGEEPDWEKPKPAREDMGNGNWGSIRTVLFSGLGNEDILVCLSLLEEAGLPQLLVAVANPENCFEPLGEVLAKTVKEQRFRASKPSPQFDGFARNVDELSKSKVGQQDNSQEESEVSYIAPSKAASTSQARPRPTSQQPWDIEIASSSDSRRDSADRSIDTSNGRNFDRGSSSNQAEQVRSSADSAMQDQFAASQQSSQSHEAGATSDFSNGATINASETLNPLTQPIPKESLHSSAGATKIDPTGGTTSGQLREGPSDSASEAEIVEEYSAPGSQSRFQRAFSRANSVQSGSSNGQQGARMTFAGQSTASSSNRSSKMAQDSNKVQKKVLANMKKEKENKNLPSRSGKSTSGSAASKIDVKGLLESQRRTKEQRAFNSRPAQVSELASEAASVPQPANPAQETARGKKSTPHSMRGLSLIERLEAQKGSKSKDNGAVEASERLQQSGNAGQSSAPAGQYAFSRRQSPSVAPEGPQIGRWKKPQADQIREAEPTQSPGSQGPSIGRWKASSVRGASDPDRPQNGSASAQRTVGERKAPSNLPPDSPIGFSPNIQMKGNSSAASSAPSSSSLHQESQQDLGIRNRTRARSNQAPAQGSDILSSARDSTTASSSSSSQTRSDDLKQAARNDDTLQAFARAEEAEQQKLRNEQESVMQELEEGVPGATAIFGANVLTHETAEEQRRLRREAADEMERRAAIAKASGNDTAYQEAMNMIDAVAAGEDVSSLLKGGAKKAPALKQSLKQTADENKAKLEQVLNQLRAGAATLPADKRAELDRQVKVLEQDKENISQVLSQLGAGLESVPEDDQDQLKSQLKKEAWDPTKDAIGAALACGISAEELRRMVAEAEARSQSGAGGWYPTVAQASKKDLQQFQQ